MTPILSELYSWNPNIIRNFRIKIRKKTGNFEWIIEFFLISFQILTRDFRTAIGFIEYFSNKIRGDQIWTENHLDHGRKMDGIRKSAFRHLSATVKFEYLLTVWFVFKNFDIKWKLRIVAIFSDDRTTLRNSKQWLKSVKNIQTHFSRGSWRQKMPKKCRSDINPDLSPKPNLILK